ncbi:MAG: hypothetical protein ACTHLV_25715, partial [Achromobacter mucicolens]
GPAARVADMADLLIDAHLGRREVFCAAQYWCQMWCQMHRCGGVCTHCATPKKMFVVFIATQHTRI